MADLAKLVDELSALTVMEAADLSKMLEEKWGVSARQINYYCIAGRIPGAVKMATLWLIPKDAKKPVDGRTKQGRALKHE